MPIHAHQLVAATARGMAEELFDMLLHGNDTFARYKDLSALLAEMQSATVNASQRQIRQRFVTLATEKLLEQARATLAQMLTTPISQDLKNTIAEALILDNELRGHREGPVH